MCHLHTPNNNSNDDDGLCRRPLTDENRNHSGDIVDDNDETPISNESLLGTAFVSFFSFALVQLSFAFVADSEAMKGDSAAMLVDALTYLFNWIAEYRKSNFDHTTISTAVTPGIILPLNQQQQQPQHNDDLDPARLRRIRKRGYRKMVLQMEIIPPALSVTTLIAVTIVVTYQAALVLVYHRRHENPNLQLMMTFSVVNLGLDGLNVFCFAKAKHLMGYSTTAHNHHDQELTTVRSSSPNTTTTTTPMRGSEPDEIIYRDMTVAAKEESNGSLNNTATTENGFSSNHVCRGDMEHANDRNDNDDDSDHSHDDDDDRTNLNMCSAYTHVFADTLRSLAVILAASLAEVVDGITPEEADASAAIIVSILIVLSLVPLFHGMVQSITELRGIYAEEKSEVMLLQQQADSQRSMRGELT